MSVERPQLLARWRLILGEAAEPCGISCGDDEELRRVEALVGFLFDPPDGGNPGARPRSRQGGRGRSQLTVPEWIDGVAELFPRSAKEVLERELLRRRGIGELLSQPDLLERVEPNVEIVKTLLTHKELLNPQTRVLARKIIDAVVRQLRQQMQLQVEQAVTGAIRRDRHSPRRVFRNLTFPPRCGAT